MTGVDNALLRKAVALLARRAYSRGDLGRRLARRGDSGAVDDVLDRLEQLNLLNDADYAYNSASRWMKQEGWGPMRVFHRLVQQNVSEVIAETAIERLQREIDPTELLEAYLERRCRTCPLPENRKGIQKLYQSLLRRGYRSETIRSVLRHRIPSSAWQDFDTGE